MKDFIKCILRIINKLKKKHLIGAKLIAETVYWNIKAIVEILSLFL